MRVALHSFGWSGAPERIDMTTKLNIDNEMERNSGHGSVDGKDVCIQLNRNTAGGLDLSITVVLRK